MRHSIYLLTLSALLTGCLADAADETEADIQVDWQHDGKADGQACGYGLTPRQYYSLFSVGDPAVTAPRYRMLTTWNTTETVSNGDKVALQAYLLPNHRVIFEYAEQHRRDANSSYDLNRTMVVTWAEFDDLNREIRFPGIGTAVPYTRYASGAYCVAGMKVRMEQDLRTPGLASDLVEIVNATSSRRPIDPDHLEYLSPTMRRYFEEDVANGTIRVIRY